LTSNQAVGGASMQIPVSGVPEWGGGVAEGGAAYVLGAVTFTGGSITDNQAVGGEGKQGKGGAARGGGLAQALSSTAAVKLRNVSVSRNTAQGGGTETPVQAALH